MVQYGQVVMVAVTVSSPDDPRPVVMVSIGGVVKDSVRVVVVVSVEEVVMAVVVPVS